MYKNNTNITQRWDTSSYLLNNYVLEIKNRYGKYFGLTSHVEVEHFDKSCLKKNNILDSNTRRYWGVTVTTSVVRRPRAPRQIGIND